MLAKNLLLATTLTIVAALSAAPVVAQSSEPPDRPQRYSDPDAYYKAPGSVHGKTVLLPVGTTFEGRIDQTISSTASRRGTRFNIVIDSPVLINGADVVIPTGSKIIGEVVEAVPASQVPKQLGQDKRLIKGKLRVQISGLETPDGAMYPLVAQLQGEVIDAMHKYMEQYRNPIGSSVGYVGSATGFEAANANRVNNDIMRQQRKGMGPQLMAKKEFLKDEALGFGPERNELDFSSVRSLVLKGHDYYIYNGSPLTVKVTAPFKIGMSNPGQGVSVGSIGNEPRDTQLPPPSAERQVESAPAKGNANPPASLGNNMQPEGQRNAVPPDSF